MIGKLQRKRLLWRPRRGWEDNFKIDLGVICVSVWTEFVCLGMGSNGGIFWIRWSSLGFCNQLNNCTIRKTTLFSCERRAAKTVVGSVSVEIKLLWRQYWLCELSSSSTNDFCKMSVYTAPSGLDRVDAAVGSLTASQSGARGSCNVTLNWFIYQKITRQKWREVESST
jgi:hypothetical protein